MASWNFPRFIIPALTNDHPECKAPRASDGLRWLLSTVIIWNQIFPNLKILILFNKNLKRYLHNFEDPVTMFILQTFKNMNGYFLTATWFSENQNFTNFRWFQFSVYYFPSIKVFEWKIFIPLVGVFYTNFARDSKIVCSSANHWGFAENNSGVASRLSSPQVTV